MSDNRQSGFDEDEWLTAADTMAQVGGAMGQHTAALTICGRAHDELVRTRAERFIKHQASFEHVELPSQFWWAEGHEARDQNWVSGDFSTWINRTYQWKAYGVRFNRADIEALLPKRERATFPRTQPGNYAPAATCLRELQTALGCSSETAEQLILRACRAGVVPARCADMRCRVLDRHGEHESGDTDVAVPQWFWEDCLDSKDAILNWKSGRFAGSGLVDGDLYKAIVSGLEFQVGAIVELEGIDVPSDDANRPPAPADQAQVQASTPKTGRKLSDDWKPWVAELVSYIHVHGFPEGVGSQGQEELIKGVAEALAKRGKEGLSRSTVQPVVQAVLDRHRSGEN